MPETIESDDQLHSLIRRLQTATALSRLSTLEATEVFQVLSAWGYRIQQPTRGTNA